MEDEPPGYHEAGSTSAAPPQEKPSSKYALLSFSWTDRISLRHFSDGHVARILEILRMSWEKGIQDVKAADGNVEIKLRGNPFAHGMDKEKINIRKVLLSVLEALAKDGWIVMPAGGLGRIGNRTPTGEKGSLVFQHQPQLQSLSLFCISFDSSDLVHLIHSSPTLEKSIIDALGDEIQKTCSQDVVTGNFEIKLKNTLFL